MITAFLILFGIYYGLSLACYAVPLWAVMALPLPPMPPDPLPVQEKPFLIIIAASRNAPKAIAGMIAWLKKQDYPAHRYRILILIDSDSAEDPSAALARSAGVEVYERRNAVIKTKGAALNELLDRQLKHEPWDALVILDIDARPDSHFLTRVAAYLNQGAQVIQAVPASRNGSETVVSHISHAAQQLSQLIQQGRAILRLPAILSGTGMVFTRSSMMKLGWKTSTGAHRSDDGELNLRCYLRDIPMTYGSDLRLMNDVPAQLTTVRLQRRNWFMAHVEAFSYIVPLLRKSIRDRSFPILEGLFVLVFLPGCSLLFIGGGLMTLGLGLVSVQNAHYAGWAGLMAALWCLHILYYALALRQVNAPLQWQELTSLPAFLWMRMVSVWEGAIIGSRKNPSNHTTPTPHGEHP